jgi:hypothetical protein
MGGAGGLVQSYHAAGASSTSETRALLAANGAGLASSGNLDTGLGGYHATERRCDAARWRRGQLLLLDAMRLGVRAPTLRVHEPHAPRLLLGGRALGGVVQSRVDHAVRAGLARAVEDGPPALRAFGRITPAALRK